MSNCGYCGLENGAEATHCLECGTEFPRPAAAETLSALSVRRWISPEAIDSAFDFADGFHRADWERIRRWIESHVAPPDAREAWNEAALHWVAKLRHDLGGGYFVLESRQAILLCDKPLATARWLLDYVGRATFTIQKHLGDAAWGGESGRHVVIVFSDSDDYYQYIAHHSPDGEQAASGGVCIDSGYTHIAVPWQDETDVANAIVHELTHDCLAHLPLPLWLNEGVAVTLQTAIAPPGRAIGQSDQSVFRSAAINWRAPIMWDELAERHFAFWTAENLQSFWAGTSFYEPGDSNELSYSLAEVFVKLLSEKGNAATFRVFLRTARAEDAGQTAALETLGADLGEIAGTFLGAGNWRPRRKALIACWESAGWQKGGNEVKDPVPPDR